MATKKQLIVPTAINFVTAVNEQIRFGRGQGQDAMLLLPTLFTRARLVYSEQGMLPIQIVTLASEPFFTK
jgi:hypothetical protein